jgi:hypothetical protein
MSWFKNVRVHQTKEQKNGMELILDLNITWD